MVNLKYAVIRSETQEAYEVAMHSKLASDWELFVTLRKQKNKEMKRTRALFSRDADATASLWRKEHGSRPGGQQSSCATRDRIHARK
jgi:hypothetical protein